MIFLATPHHGSEVADFVDGAIRKMSLGFFSKPYITELRSDSSVLSEIDKGFHENLPGITIVSFCETRGIPLANLVSSLVRLSRQKILIVLRWSSRRPQQS